MLQIPEHISSSPACNVPKTPATSSLQTIYSVPSSFTSQMSCCFMYVCQMHGHPPNMPRILKEWSCISMRLMKLFMAKSARHCVSLTISASSCDGSVVLSAFTKSMASLAPAKVGNKTSKLCKWTIKQKITYLAMPQFSQFWRVVFKVRCTVWPLLCDQSCYLQVLMTSKFSLCKFINFQHVQLHLPSSGLMTIPTLHLLCHVPEEASK